MASCYGSGVGGELTVSPLCVPIARRDLGLEPGLSITLQTQLTVLHLLVRSHIQINILKQPHPWGCLNTSVERGLLHGNNVIGYSVPRRER